MEIEFFLYAILILLLVNLLTPTIYAVIGLFAYIVGFYEKLRWFYISKTIDKTDGQFMYPYAIREERFFLNNHSFTAFFPTYCIKNVRVSRWLWLKQNIYTWQFKFFYNGENGKIFFLSYDEARSFFTRGDNYISPLQNSNIDRLINKDMGTFIRTTPIYSNHINFHYPDVKKIFSKWQDPKTQTVQ